MRKKDSAEEKSRLEEFERWSLAVERAAAKIMEVGDELFRHGAPSDSALAWISTERD